ncbi:hypothetical protein [Vibrio brasiliensis]
MSDVIQIGPNHWVGPEEFGFTPHFHIFQHSAENYPNGQLTPMDPLNPGNKRIPVVDDTTKPSEIDDLRQLVKSVSAGRDEGFLDMRVQSVHSRGDYMGIAAIFTYLWLALKGQAYSEGLAWSDTYVVDLIALSLIGIIIAIELYRPIVTPVRFHKNNQEVYVWHKKILYRIPWHECELTIVASKHMGYGRFNDDFALMLWLNPKHAVNADLTGHRYKSLCLFHDMSRHAPVYRYWEYVRQYMADERSLWIEINKAPPFKTRTLTKKEAKRKKQKAYLLC